MLTKTKLLFFIAAVCVVFSFVGNPDTRATRSLAMAWDMGHIVAYCLWTYLLVTYWRPLAKRFYGGQWFGAVTLTLLFGVAVELIQKEFLGRTASLGDISKNMIGCALALSFLAPARKKAMLRVVMPLKFLVLVAFVAEFLPLAQAVTDEWIAKEQLPHLATFETPFEISRWEAHNAAIAVDYHIKSEGKVSLRMDVNIDGFSGAYLRFFPRDWRNYEKISFKVYNPRSDGVGILFRVNDFDFRRNGWHRSDRYGRKFFLKPGWNPIEIPLEEIENAPASRRMNLAEIESVGFMTYYIFDPQSLYLDDIRLHPKM